MRTQWQGRAASSGRAVGKVLVLIDEGYADAPDYPFVLVARTTNTGLVSLMLEAKAIVTDIGGIMAHAAVVARELGIPCVVATGSASQDLKTGDLVEVDGFDGSVNLLERMQDAIE